MGYMDGITYKPTYDKAAHKIEYGAFKNKTFLKNYKIIIRNLHHRILHGIIKEKGDEVKDHPILKCINKYFHISMILDNIEMLQRTYGLITTAVFFLNSNGKKYRTTRYWMTDYNMTEFMHLCE